MITSLRHRVVADRFENDVRARKARYGKWIYLSILGAGVLWIANTLVGPMVWLQAEGLISSERLVIGSPYESQVVDLAVREGEKVHEGQVLASVYSPKVVDALATLASRRAEVQARRGDLAVRVEVAETLHKFASDRSQQADSILSRMRTAHDPGLVTATNWMGTLREHFEAKQALAALEAERRVARQQLADLDAAQEDAAAAMEDLKRRYSDGVVHAPADGIVGSTIAKRGHVLQVGDSLFELFSGKPFVLAYVETGALHRVHAGDRVIVSDGFSDSGGVISNVLPMADQLPAEFQKSFKPRGRSQVVHIRLDDAAAFPLMSKVSVRGSIDLPSSLENLEPYVDLLRDRMDAAGIAARAWADRADGALRGAYAALNQAAAPYIERLHAVPEQDRSQTEEN